MRGSATSTTMKILHFPWNKLLLCVLCHVFYFTFAGVAAGLKRTKEIRIAWLAPKETFIGLSAASSTNTMKIALRNAELNYLKGFYTRWVIFTRALSIYIHSKLLSFRRSQINNLSTKLKLIHWLETQTYNWYTNNWYTN